MTQEHREEITLRAAKQDMSINDVMVNLSWYMKQLGLQWWHPLNVHTYVEVNGDKVAVPQWWDFQTQGWVYGRARMLESSLSIVRCVAEPRLWCAERYDGGDVLRREVLVRDQEEYGHALMRGALMVMRMF